MPVAKYNGLDEDDVQLFECGYQLMKSVAV